MDSWEDNQMEWICNIFPSCSRLDTPKQGILILERFCGAALWPTVEDRGCAGQLQGMNMCDGMNVK